MGGQPTSPRVGEGAERPTLTAHHVTPLAVPASWPEAIAYRAGTRLAADERDDIPAMIRAGVRLDLYLTEAEVGASLILGLRSFERWFGLGFGREAADEETE